MGCADPHTLSLRGSKGGRRTPSVFLLGSVASFLCHVMLTCGFTFR